MQTISFTHIKWLMKTLSLKFLLTTWSAIFLALLLRKNSHTVLHASAVNVILSIAPLDLNHGFLLHQDHTKIISAVTALVVTRLGSSVASAHILKTRHLLLKMKILEILVSLRIQFEFYKTHKQTSTLRGAKTHVFKFSNDSTFISWKSLRSNQKCWYI